MLIPTKRTVLYAGVIFWLALVVLVANDHWLKGSALLPGWLTGKLSDFAGLIVAPIVLVGVTRTQTARGRLGWIALIALVFAGFELFPSWGRALSSLDAIGVHLRTWPDLSDLSALAILPVTYWVLQCRTLRQRLRLGPEFWHRGGLILGSVACLATTIDPGPVVTLPLIENRSHVAVEVSTRRYLGEARCDEGTAFGGAVPDPDDYDEPVTATLEPTEQVSVGRRSDSDCGAIWLSSPQLEDLIFCYCVGRREPGAEDDGDQDLLIIEGPAEELRAYPGPGLWISNELGTAGDRP